MRLPAAPVLCSALCLTLVSAAPIAQQAVSAALTAKPQRTAIAPFQLADTANNTVRLADFHGKPVVLNLWATECGGCNTELPTFVRLDRTYRKSGLTVVGVSFDILYSDLKSPSEGWAQVKPFLRTHRIQYRILLDDGSVEKALAVNALPATYLIDRSGRIAATYVGVVDSANLESNVKLLLAEH